MGRGGAKCRDDRTYPNIYFAGSHLAVAKRHPVGNQILGNHIDIHGGEYKWEN